MSVETNCEQIKQVSSTLHPFLFQYQLGKSSIHTHKKIHRFHLMCARECAISLILTGRINKLVGQTKIGTNSRKFI